MSQQFFSIRNWHQQTLLGLIAVLAAGLALIANAADDPCKLQTSQSLRETQMFSGQLNWKINSHGVLSIAITPNGSNRVEFIYRLATIEDGAVDSVTNGWPKPGSSGTVVRSETFKSDLLEISFDKATDLATFYTDPFDCDDLSFESEDIELSALSFNQLPDETESQQSQTIQAITDRPLIWKAQDLERRSSFSENNSTNDSLSCKAGGPGTFSCSIDSGGH